MKYILTLLFVLTFLMPKAQDTIKMMHYNLLNYGNITSYCDATNNNISNKDIYNRTIIDYVLPDILTVNEIGGSRTAVERYLDTVLNENGRSHYSMANYSNGSGSSLLNMLYYNSLKISWHSQTRVFTNTRDINIYKLYYNSNQLISTGDTAFLIVIVAHLKAGSSSSDRTERADMTNKLMTYLNTTNTTGNILFAGDFNVQSSNETSYQNLITNSNPSIKFYDPITTPGSWNNSSSYSNVHTQSTHSSSNGCASGGGLDDRFDFILMNSDVLNGSNHYQYLNNTYIALGNDGNHFNTSINASPINNSVPSNVLSALYNSSDHLPILLELKVNQDGAGIHEEILAIKGIYPNPLQSGDQLSIQLERSSSVKIQLYSIFGQMIWESDNNQIAHQHDFSIQSSIPKGIYLLKILDDQGKFRHHKIIIR